MRCLVACSLSAALLVGAASCRNCDRVESELRVRENEVRELREDNERLEFYNHAMQRELLAVHGVPGPTGAVEKPHDPYPVQTLALGRQTGGRPSETLPADDALQVQLEPRDPEGQSIKAPGWLTVEVVEISPDGLKRPLSCWEIPPEDLRQHWRNGLLTTGYVLVLPWKVWPTTPKLRVVARFRLPSSRVLEADRDVTVRVLPPDKHPILPPPIPDPAPAPVPLPAPAPAPAPVPAPMTPAPGLPLSLPASTPAPPPPQGMEDLPPPRPLERFSPQPPRPVTPVPSQQGPTLGRSAKVPLPPPPPIDMAAPAAEILRPVPFGQIRD